MQTAGSISKQSPPKTSSAQKVAASAIEQPSRRSPHLVDIFESVSSASNHQATPARGSHSCNPTPSQPQSSISSANVSAGSKKSADLPFAKAQAIIADYKENNMRFTDETATYAYWSACSHHDVRPFTKKFDAFTNEGGLREATAQAIGRGKGSGVVCGVSGGVLDIACVAQSQAGIILLDANPELHEFILVLVAMLAITDSECDSLGLDGIAAAEHQRCQLAECWLYGNRDAQQHYALQLLELGAITKPDRFIALCSALKDKCTKSSLYTSIPNWLTYSRRSTQSIGYLASLARRGRIASVCGQVDSIDAATHTRDILSKWHAKIGVFNLSNVFEYVESVANISRNLAALPHTPETSVLLTSRRATLSAEDIERDPCYMSALGSFNKPGIQLFDEWFHSGSPKKIDRFQWSESDNMGAQLWERTLHRISGCQQMVTDESHSTSAPDESTPARFAMQRFAHTCKRIMRSPRSQTEYHAFVSNAERLLFADSKLAQMRFFLYLQERGLVHADAVFTDKPYAQSLSRPRAFAHMRILAKEHERTVTR